MVDRVIRTWERFVERYWLWYGFGAILLLVLSPVIAPPLKRLFGF